MRKYTPKPAKNGKSPNWNTLHDNGGKTEFLFFRKDKTSFVWTTNEKAARNSQKKWYPNVEGVSFKNGMLYFVSKKTYTLYKLDLDKGTYSTSVTNDEVLGDGEFRHSPDQLIRNDGEFLYLTEDGGKTPGVYAVDSSGEKYAIIEAYASQYFGDETTGLAFSPDGTRMYGCFQDCGCEVTGAKDCGCLLEFWRDDGRSFDGETMALKFHSNSEKRSV